MSRPFPWNGQRHQKLHNALRDQKISNDTPLAWIGEVTIGFHPNSSRSSISIGDEAFTNCLNDDQRDNLASGREVKVLGYNEDGKQQKGLKLKKNRDGHAVLEGPWGKVMQQNRWSSETRICFWGFPCGERNSGEPCFVLTDNI